jgi:hypothetical protein
VTPVIVSRYVREIAVAGLKIGDWHIVDAEPSGMRS